MDLKVEKKIAEKEELAPPVKAGEPTGASEPWAPAKILEVSKKPGYRRKWVREDLVDRFLSEQWTFVDPADVSSPNLTDVDGAPSDGTRVQKRELVLMEITEELALSREEYYKKQTDGALAGSIKDFKDLANSGGGKSYGKVEIHKGGN